MAFNKGADNRKDAKSVIVYGIKYIGKDTEYK
jgi:hypothetical protein